MTGVANNNRSYTLILLHRPGSEDDFKAIGERITARAPEIAVATGSVFAENELPAVMWQRATLIISLNASFKLVPKRGLVYRCRAVLKSEQFELYRAAGLKTPLTARFTFGMKPDPAEWGDYVVLKPLRINSKGEGIHLVRTRRINSLTAADFAEDHPIHRDQYLIQQFIDTGEFPCHYRVLSFLGEPLYCRRNFATIKRPALDDDDAVLMKGNIASNAGVAGTGSTELMRDDEVLAFARRMHQAMPGIPLQGLDILRNVQDGELYALESNAGGNTWAFSSKLGENARRVLGGAGPMIEQFGAWDVAADALIRKTRAEAR